MRKIFAILALLYASLASAITYTPISTLNPAGSTSGQFIASTGPTSAPAWTTVSLSGIGALARANNLSDLTSASTARTNLGLGTAATVSTGTSGATIPLLSTANTWTLAQAFTVRPTFNSNTPWDSGNLIFATPPAIGGTTPAAGSFTTLAASSTVSGTGFSSYLASPPAIGATAPNTGNFTRLAASGNDALLYTNTSGQSIPNSTATTVTGWTLTSDRLNTNFAASTGVFTAPVTGLYLVSAQITFATAVNAIGNIFQVSAVANSVTVATGFAVQQGTGTVATIVVVPATVVSMTAGQTLVIQANQTSGGAKTLSTSAALSFLSIYRLP